MRDENGNAIPGTLPEPDPPRSGTAWIVWGALLLAWGVIVALNAVVTQAGPYIVVALLPLGLGVWLLVVGLNKRRAWLAR